MKDLLVSPKLENFKNGEFSKYVRTLLELSKEEDLDAMQLKTHAKKLESDYEAFRKVYKKTGVAYLLQSWQCWTDIGITV